MPILGTVKQVNREICELEGPYECPNCGGHMMLDATFLDQVDRAPICPYCYIVLDIPEPTWN